MEVKVTKKTNTHSHVKIYFFTIDEKRHKKKYICTKM